MSPQITVSPDKVLWQATVTVEMVKRLHDLTVDQLMNDLNDALDAICGQYGLKWQSEFVDNQIAEKYGRAGN
jgi:hypothetical protein